MRFKLDIHVFEIVLPDIWH